MTPSFSIDNAVDCISANTITVGNGLLCQTGDGSYLENLLFGKFGPGMVTTTRLSTSTIPIIHIILMSSKSQMIRIAAQSIVA